ncbi:MAG: hypothetical protein ACK55I_32130, partial [bacterium]
HVTCVTQRDGRIPATFEDTRLHKLHHQHRVRASSTAVTAASTTTWRHDRCERVLGALYSNAMHLPPEFRAAVALDGPAGPA